MDMISLLNLRVAGAGDGLEDQCGTIEDMKCYCEIGEDMKGLCKTTKIGLCRLTHHLKNFEEIYEKNSLIPSKNGQGSVIKCQYEIFGKTRTSW